MYFVTADVYGTRFVNGKERYVLLDNKCAIVPNLPQVLVTIANWEEDTPNALGNIRVVKE